MRSASPKRSGTPTGIDSQRSEPVLDPISEPSREVLRCEHCMLVQFRSEDSLCRRCRKPVGTENEQEGRDPTVHALELLTNNTELSLRELAALLGISARSLASCKSSGLFAVQDSDRILRIAAVFEKALELFDGEALAAMQWMRQPQKALGGEIPIARSGSQLGAREVENLIGRLGEGVYS